jgi:hypothetical protein
MANDQIMIIWEGQVQVRVELVNQKTKKLKSYWFDTLDKGACISVFSCFSDFKSLINLYASSPHCIIQFIKAKDLEKLGQEIISLNDRLSVIKLRIQNKEVDDIDYFTFPMH